MSNLEQKPKVDVSAQPWPTHTRPPNLEHKLGSKPAKRRSKSTRVLPIGPSLVASVPKAEELGAEVAVGRNTLGQSVGRTWECETLSRLWRRGERRERPKLVPASCRLCARIRPTQTGADFEKAWPGLERATPGDLDNTSGASCEPGKDRPTSRSAFRHARQSAGAADGGGPSEWSMCGPNGWRLPGPMAAGGDGVRATPRTAAPTAHRRAPLLTEALRHPSQASAFQDVLAEKQGKLRHDRCCVCAVVRSQ